MTVSTRSSLFLDIIQRLDPLTHAYRFLPVGGGGDGKAPLINDWPNYPGASIELLSCWPGIKSIGVITGPFLACFDLDGHSAIEKAITA